MLFRAWHRTICDLIQHFSPVLLFTNSTQFSVSELGPLISPHPMYSLPSGWSADTLISAARYLQRKFYDLPQGCSTLLHFLSWAVLIPIHFLTQERPIPPVQHYSYLNFTTWLLSIIVLSAHKPSRNYGVSRCIPDGACGFPWGHPN